jgi:thymidine phosphorylase
MVHALGGPADFVETWQAHLPKAPVDMAIYPIDPGYVTAINTRALGEAVVNLGGGRKTESDTIDLSVGLSHIAQIGDHVDDHAPLLRIHAVSKDQADAIGHVLQKAFVTGPNPPTRPRLIQAVIA